LILTDISEDNKTVYMKKGKMLSSFMYNLRKKTKLGPMFAFMVLIVIVSVSTISYAHLYLSNKKALEEKLLSKAKSILDFADVLLESRNKKFFSGESSEIPQVVQNDVFGRFTDISKGEVFFKEASNHPMNPKNKALPFESEEIDFFKKNKNIKEHSRTVIMDGKKYFMLSRPIRAQEKCKMCHPSWKVGDVIAVENVKIDLKNFLSDLKNNLITIITSWFFNVILVMVVILILFHKEIALRITVLSKAMKKIGKGDFNIKDILQKEKVKKDNKNEIDVLFCDLYDMASSIKPVIDHVVSQAENVSQKSSYGMSKTIDNNKKVNEQTIELREIEDSTKELLEKNDHLEKVLNNLNDKVKDMILDIEDTRKVLDRNTKEANEAYKSLDNTVVAIEELEKYSKNIDKTIDIISNIAEETNLIALNAAIEAARAGVYGRSFMVVADKVRELAEISQENAKNISQIIQTMQKNIQVVTKNADSTKKSFDSFLKEAKKINDNFQQSEKILVNILEVFNNFEKEFQIQSAQFEKINDKIDITTQQSKIIEKNSENIKDIMKDIINESEKLKTLSEGFEKIVN